MARPADHVRGLHRLRRLRDLAAFSVADYYASPYLSPFYSPCLAAPASRAPATSAPRWATAGGCRPALIILIFPLGFRMSCYYYRKAYYRAFWLSPPACAVAEPHGRYTGESRLPLILNNVHRYFWYAAMVVGPILTLDTVLAFRDADGEWGHMGLGTAALRGQHRADLALHASAATRAGTCSGGGSGTSPRTRCATGLDGRLAAEHPPRRATPGLSLFSVAIARPVRLPAGHRRLRRPEVLLTWLEPSATSSSPPDDRQPADAGESPGPRHGLRDARYDVVVIGAGGAGLRAAIAAHDAGAERRDRVQVAAGQGAHGDGRGRDRRGHGQRATPRTAGRCTSATPCAAARCSTTGGWRSCTRRRRPSACSSWRSGVRSSTAPTDGLISQRDFGGHRYARLAHVGDRTGLEMIRTLQQRAVDLGIDVFMECTVTELFRDDAHGRPRISGAFGYWRETGRFIVFDVPDGRPRHRRDRQVLPGRRRTRGSTPATGTRSRCGPAPA